ncbi:MAG: helix-turn-helix transcriptional regulator [Castellaniella sp.]|jgi:predicted transcriptional regulator|uniref:helix-turn-helix domain-containing protein n=1 Tax=Castellaniella sp. TaxID=1955812 RepID=UPI003C750F40
MRTHEELKSLALSDPEVRAEYERIEREEMPMLDAILKARAEAGLTQAQVAVRMGTQAPAVARLENALMTGKHSPSIATLQKYAAALGKKLEVRFV